MDEENKNTSAFQLDIKKYQSCVRTEDKETLPRIDKGTPASSWLVWLVGLYDGGVRVFLVLTPVSSVIQRVPGGVPLVSGGARPGDDFPASGPLYLGVIKHRVRPSLRGGSGTKNQHSSSESNWEMTKSTWLQVRPCQYYYSHETGKIITKQK